MSGTYSPTLMYYGPSGGRPGRGYLIRTTSPEAGEFGGYEYSRIWITVPKDMPEAIPTDKGFRTYRKVDLDTDPDLSSAPSSVLTQNDFYEFTSDEFPSLRRDSTSYLPVVYGRDAACCIIDSVAVGYSGTNPGEVAQILAKHAEIKKFDNAAKALKDLRPFVLKTGPELGKKIYVFWDSVPGSDVRNVSCYVVGGLSPYDYIGDFSSFKTYAKQLAKTEGMHVGDVPDSAYGKVAHIIFGVVTEREGGKWRRVDYGSADDTLSSAEDRRRMSNEVEPLEQPSPPAQPEGTPAPPAPLPTPGEAKIEEVELPAGEKRTRAQLYAALVAAEKYGDRTIRASRFEGNARQLGSDTYSHETVIREAPNMTQGELVSLVTVLVNRIMADDVIIDTYNKAKSEGRVLDAPQRAPSVRIETNLIIGGVGYDPQ